MSYMQELLFCKGVTAHELRLQRLEVVHVSSVMPESTKRLIDYMEVDPLCAPLLKTNLKVLGLFLRMIKYKRRSYSQKVRYMLLTIILCAKTPYVLSFCRHILSCKT